MSIPLDGPQSNNERPSSELSERDVPVTPGMRAVSFREALLGAESERALYEHQRAWSYSSVPAWVQDVCYDVAKTRYWKVAPEAVVEMFRDFVSDSGDLLQAAAGYFRGGGRLDSGLMFKILKKAIPSDGTAFGIVLPQHVVADLGFDRYRTLAEVRQGAAEESASTEDWGVLMRVALSKNALFSSFLGSGALQERYRAEDLHFRREYPGSLGKAASQTFGELSEFLVAHQLCADALEGLGVELPPAKMKTLVEEVRKDPWNKLASSSRLEMIQQYQSRLREESWQPLALSEGEMLVECAFNRVPFETMKERDSRISQSPASGQMIAGIESDYVAESNRPEHELRREALERAISNHEELLGVSFEPRAKHAMIGQCLKRKISPADLQKTLEELLDADLIIKALRDVSRQAQVHEGGLPTPEQCERGVAMAEREGAARPSTRCDVRMFQVKGRAVVAEWLTALKRPERAKIEKLLAKVLEGRLDGAKPVQVGRPAESSLELYEIKDSSGLSVYFRRVPGNVIVLLNGGTKSSREGDVRIAVSYARSLDSLKEGDVVPHPVYGAERRRE